MLFRSNDFASLAGRGEKPTRRDVLRLGGAAAAACAVPSGAARAQGAVKRIRFAHESTVTSAWQLWAEQFKKSFEDKTGAKFQVQIFPNAQMGNERDAAQAIRIGSLEMGGIGAGLMGWVPEMAVTDAPFLWKSRPQAHRALDGAFGEELRRRCLDKGFRLAGWAELGSRGMTSSKKLIKSTKDLVGLKMRVPAAKSYIAMMEALGASTVAVDISELYLALSQGLADGCELPPAVIKSVKLYEVQKYFSKTDHILGTAYTVVNPKTYDALTPEEQTAFNAAGKAADVFVREFAEKDELESYGFFQKQGLEVAMEVDSQSFRDAAGPVIGKFPELFAPDLVKLAQATPA